MNAIIIEDEKLAAERLEGILNELRPDIRVVAKIPSIKEAVRWFMKNRVDLIFLDIQLSDGLSFSIFEQVQIDTPVIFTTAYDNYAIKAFELNSLDYLLKPIRKDHLSKSLTKYESLKSSRSIDFNRLLQLISNEKPEYKKRFLVQIGDKLKKIDTEQIAYFYAFEKSVFIKTSDNHDYPIEYSLDALETEIDPGMFFRINRKYFVQMTSIKSMIAWSRSRVKLELIPKPDQPDETIVSIERAGDFKKWMSN